jgi:hypothetical protein
MQLYDVFDQGTLRKFANVQIAAVLNEWDTASWKPKAGIAQGF